MLSEGLQAAKLAMDQELISTLDELEKQGVIDKKLKEGFRSDIEKKPEHAKEIFLHICSLSPKLQALEILKGAEEKLQAHVEIYHHQLKKARSLLTSIAAKTGQTVGNGIAERNPVPINPLRGASDQAFCERFPGGKKTFLKEYEKVQSSISFHITTTRSSIQERYDTDVKAAKEQTHRAKTEVDASFNAQATEIVEKIRGLDQLIEPPGGVLLYSEPEKKAFLQEEEAKSLEDILADLKEDRRSDLGGKRKDIARLESLIEAREARIASLRGKFPDQTITSMQDVRALVEAKKAEILANFTPISAAHQQIEREYRAALDIAEEVKKEAETDVEKKLQDLQGSLGELEKLARAFGIRLPLPRVE